MKTRCFSQSLKDRETLEYQQAFREIKEEVGDTFVEYAYTRLIDERTERIIEAKQQKAVIDNTEQQIELYLKLVKSYQSDEQSYKKCMSLQDEMIRMLKLQIEVLDRSLFILRLRSQTFLFPIL